MPVAVAVLWSLIPACVHIKLKRKGDECHQAGAVGQNNVMFASAQHSVCRPVFRCVDGRAAKPRAPVTAKPGCRAPRALADDASGSSYYKVGWESVGGIEWHNRSYKGQSSHEYYYRHTTDPRSSLESNGVI